MGVGDVIAVHAGGVAFGDVLFLNGIGDLVALLIVGGQVAEGERPTGVRRSVMLFDHLSVGQQLDNDLVRPYSVGVVVVIPNLRAGDDHRLHAIGVDQVVALHLADVARERILVNGVDDLLAVLVLGHPLEGVRIGAAPYGGIDHLVGHLMPIGIQAHRDAPRAAPAPLIQPGLGAGDINGLIVMRVDDGLIIRIIDGHIARGYVDLLDAVDDLLACSIGLGQVLPDMVPAVLGRQAHRLTVGLAVRQQLDLDVLRADAVGIIAVHPDLLDRKAHIPAGLIRRVGVKMALCVGIQVLTDDAAVVVAGDLLHVRIRGDHMTDPVLRGQHDSGCMLEVPHDGGAFAALLVDSRFLAAKEDFGSIYAAAFLNIDGRVDLLARVAHNVDVLHIGDVPDRHIIADVDGDHIVLIRLDDRAVPAHALLGILDHSMGFLEIKEIIIDIDRRGSVVAGVLAIDAVMRCIPVLPGADSVAGAYIQGLNVIVAGIVLGLWRSIIPLDEGRGQLITVGKAGVAGGAVIVALHQQRAHAVQAQIDIAKGQHIVPIEERRQVIIPVVIREDILRRRTFCRRGTHRYRHAAKGQHKRHGQQEHPLPPGVQILHHMHTPSCPIMPYRHS